MPRGKLIVIEGTDGSGKATQSGLLEKALKKVGEKVKMVSFPRYGHPAAYFEEKYLSGGFGTTEEVGIGAASLFYALDRFDAAPQLRLWLEKGWTVITNRYTTSSMIHHSPEAKALPEYLKWLSATEWSILGIPKPDLVLFLDVPPVVSLRLAKERAKQDKTRKLDMVEKDKAYTVRSYAKSARVAKLQKWKVIPCVKRGRMLEKEQIAAIILEQVSKSLKLSKIHS